MKKTKVQKRIAHAAMTAEKVIQVQNLRASGAPGAHDSRPKRVRTRAAAKASALKDW